MFPNWFEEIAKRNFEHYMPREKEFTALQIGAYTGDATEWLLANTKITHLDDVDTWEGSDEEAHHSLDFSTVEAYYDSRFKDEPRVSKHKMTSDKFFAKYPDRKYDFIYIDGDHTALQTALDGFNGFRLLKPGGLMAFDDYLWSCGKEDFHNPKPGVDAVLKLCTGLYQPVDFGYQVWIRKNFE